MITGLCSFLTIFTGFAGIIGAQQPFHLANMYFTTASTETPRAALCAVQSNQITIPSEKLRNKAYSEPISTNEISFIVSTPDAGTATIRVREGAMGKIIAV